LASLNVGEEAAFDERYNIRLHPTHGARSRVPRVPALRVYRDSARRGWAEPLASRMRCPTCDADERSLWTFGRPPALVEKSVGNWNTLEECKTCGALWVQIPHEPYASFRFWTRWPSTFENWRRLNDREEALIVHEWHNAVLRETWADLPADERAHVEAWRERTYRHYNPIDRGPDTPKPTYVQSASDLQNYISASAG
jgi:hypothetical protein